MIFVSGTKRSGTSMWMQVLRAAGRPVLGEAFPPAFVGGLRAANPDGFYESLLRNGIYFATNPHPVSGRYFLPEHVPGHAVKVFIPGVLRSERAYIGRLIANVRPWQEYEASITRMYALEDAALRARGQAVPEDRSDESDRFSMPPAYEWWIENFSLVRDITLRRYPARLMSYAQVLADPEDRSERFIMPPAFEWWIENFSLVRDITLRRYPAKLMSYAQVLADPEGSVAAVLDFIAGEPAAAGQVDDLAAALTAVKPGHRTQDRPVSATTLAPEVAAGFDDLHAAVADGSLFTRPALLRQLSALNGRLLPELTELQTRALESELRHARGRESSAAAIAGLPEKLAGFE